MIVIILAVQGLLIGAFARLALPGRDPLSLVQTMMVGLAGSLLAGLLAYALGGRSGAPSFLAALVFSVGQLGGSSRPWNDTAAAISVPVRATSSAHFPPKQ